MSNPITKTTNPGTTSQWSLPIPTMKEMLALGKKCSSAHAAVERLLFELRSGEQQQDDIERLELLLEEEGYLYSQFEEATQRFQECSLIDDSESAVAESMRVQISSRLGIHYAQSLPFTKGIQETRQAMCDVIFLV